MQNMYSKNYNFNKKHKYKTIIFNRPKDRIVLDITEIPQIIKEKTDYLYILNAIDHFSKLCKSYLLKNKKSLNILDCIKDFFDIYGVPLSVGTDNGREFKNKLINDYMLFKI